MSFWQGDERWGNEVIKVTKRMRAAGCVDTSLALAVNLLLRPAVPWTPLTVLRLLQRTPGALVDGRGNEPGDLIVVPVACKALGIGCGNVVADSRDHADKLHEFSGHEVDDDADVAGALASALVGGCALVRVDIDGDDQGDHTTLGAARNGNLYLLDDPALNKLVTLDENLEGGLETRWDKTPYRAVNIRPLFRLDAA